MVGRLVSTLKAKLSPMEESEIFKSRTKSRRRIPIVSWSTVEENARRWSARFFLISVFVWVRINEVIKVIEEVGGSQE